MPLLDDGLVHVQPLARINVPSGLLFAIFGTTQLDSSDDVILACKCESIDDKNNRTTTPLVLCLPGWTLQNTDDDGCTSRCRPPCSCASAAGRGVCV